MEEWFEQMSARLNGNLPSVLLVSGPSGSGKSTCIRAICHDREITILDCYDCPVPKTGAPRDSIKQSSYPTLKLVVDESTAGCSERVSTSKKVVLFDDMPNSDANGWLEEMLAGIQSQPLQVIVIVTDPCGYQSLGSDPVLRGISKAPFCHAIR